MDGKVGKQKQGISRPNVSDVTQTHLTDSKRALRALSQERTSELLGSKSKPLRAQDTKSRPTDREVFNDFAEQKLSSWSELLASAKKKPETSQSQVLGVRIGGATRGFTQKLRLSERASSWNNEETLDDRDQNLRDRQLLLHDKELILREREQLFSEKRHLEQARTEFYCEKSEFSALRQRHSASRSGQPASVDNIRTSSPQSTAAAPWVGELTAAAAGVSAGLERVESTLREMLVRMGSVEGRVANFEASLDHLRTEIAVEEAVEGPRGGGVALRQFLDPEAADGSSGPDVYRPPKGLAGWLDRFCGIRKTDRKFGREGSRLIHPHSPFAQGMLVASCLALIYSAVVVPIKLSFWQSDNACHLDSTIKFDIFIDVFFLVEIIITFFTGYHKSGAYIDNWWHVVRHYIRSPSRFWFDLFTSIPFSITDYIIAQSCEGGILSDGFVAADTIQSLRILKMFRIVRLLKFIGSIRLMQALKRFNVTALARDELAYLAGPTVIKLASTMLTLTFFVHIFACFFWRVKQVSNSETDIESFLTSRGISPGDTSGIYMVCFYFVFTVFSTVGFGDIFPVTFEERLLIAFMFVCGSVFFGYIMAQLNEILQSLNKEEKEVDQFMEGYIAFMRHCNAPAETERRILRWVRFYYTEEVAARQKREILSDPKLPDEFRVALAKSLQDNLFHQVPFLVGTIDRVRAEFAAQLLLVGETQYFARDAELGDHKGVADAMIVVLKGRVEVSLPNGHVLRILQRGDLFGDAVVVGDGRWAGGWGISANFWARSKTCIMVFRTEIIKGLLKRIEFSSIRRRIERGQFIWDENGAELEAEEAACKKNTVVKRMSPEAIFHWISTARRVLAEAGNKQDTLADAAMMARKLKVQTSGIRSSATANLVHIRRSSSTPNS